jgi:hypothetical protein
MHLNITPQEISILERLEALENDGRGIGCVKSIIILLKRDMVDEARATREWDGDKTRNYPIVENQLHHMFGCRLHGILDCQVENCLYMRDQTLKGLRDRA